MKNHKNRGKNNYLHTYKGSIRNMRTVRQVRLTCCSELRGSGVVRDLRAGKSVHEKHAFGKQIFAGPDGDKGTQRSFNKQAPLGSSLYAHLVHTTRM